MDTSVHWSGSRSAVFAGPQPPSMPTAFWLDNSSAPYVLHFWMGAPEQGWVKLGEINPVTKTFTADPS